MRRHFWKACLISAAAYAGVVLAALRIDFRVALFAVLAIQVTWTLFCVVRAIQLRHAVEPYDKAARAFALGGALSSVALFLGVVVFTQVV